MTDLLRVNDIYKSYHDGERELVVLRGASLSVARGEAVAVVGMSGSGKSTLLHLLGGLDVPDKGEIVFDGKPLGGRNISKLDDFRNRSIGYVFQFHHLLPEFTALENVIMPALISGAKADAVRPEAMETLTRLGLADRVKHRPSKLSGGEQQRVALARALINKPAVLLADEPTGNLDTARSREIMELLTHLNQERGITVLMVTHEADMAAYAKRIVRFVDGMVASDHLNQQGTPVTEAH